MKQITEDDVKELQKIFQKMDEFHSLLRKKVVHPLRGSSPSKISDTLFSESVSSSRRVLDGWGKQLKLMKRILR